MRPSIDPYVDLPGLDEVMNPIISRNPYNAHLWPKKGEVNNLPSLTVPDQTMSVKELLSRYARGLPLDISNRPDNVLYDAEDDDDDLPDPWRMDLEDRAVLEKEIHAELSAIANKPANPVSPPDTIVETAP